MLLLTLVLAATPYSDCFSTLACKSACQEGNSQACYQLGKLKWVSPEAELDVKGARALWVQACAQGNWPACIELRRHPDSKAAHNSVGQIEEERARKDACDADWYDACPDKAKALAQLEDHCESRRPRACEELARVAEKNGEPRSTELRQKACDLGALRSCVAVAAPLLALNASEADKDQGMKILEKACDNGLAQACLQVGMMLQGDSNRPQKKTLTEIEKRRPLQLLKKACQLDHFAACKAEAFLLRH